jgi:hypothetical protein
VEKRKPHYSLGAIQGQMVDVPSLRLTATAYTCIVFELGWESEDAVEVIRTLRSRDFYKSMTTTRSSRVWQDVYRATWRDTELYLKFQQHEDLYFFTVSFKEL